MHQALGGNAPYNLVMDKLFLVKEEKGKAPEGFAVARHPELVFVKSLDVSAWEAENTINGEKVRVLRLVQDNYYKYEIQSI